MSRWRIIGKRDGIQREAEVYTSPGVWLYTEAIANRFLSRVASSLPFTVSFLLSFPPPPSLSLSFPLCPHRARARSRLAPFVSFVSLLVRLGVISAQEEAFDLRFCGERAIKKCRENNIATVKSVALNPPGAGLANCPFVPPRFLVFHPCCAHHRSHFVD